MTPAEQLSKSLSKKRRRDCPAGRKQIWICELSRLRFELGLTLRDIESKTGVSSAVLSTIEHGTDPQLTTARTIARFFGKTVEELWPITLAEKAILR